MRRGRLLLTGLALVALVLPAATGAAVQLRGVDTSGYPTIHATVISPAGAKVVPAVSENGTAVAGLQLQNLGRAKATVLVVDRSQSMRGAPLANAAEAARAFVGAKQGADEVSVVAFGSRAVALSPFSTAVQDGDGALSRLQVDRARGTALYDSVALAAQLAASNPLPGRVIILLSDGASCSDVNWDFYFKEPTQVELRNQNISDIGAVPDSNIIPNPELASTQAMTISE